MYSFRETCEFTAPKRTTRQVRLIVKCYAMCAHRDYATKTMNAMKKESDMMLKIDKRP